MTRGEVKNLAASVRACLANFARERGEDFGQMLSRYARERLLYRLSASAHREQFILKGALLFSYWTGAPYPPTRDLDLLGRGEPDIQLMEQVFREICGVEVEVDGLVFPEEAVRGERNKDDEEYEGVRLHLVALLARARIPVQMDIGFGDAVVPAPEDVVLPALLDFPVPKLKAATSAGVITSASVNKARRPRPHATGATHRQQLAQLRQCSRFAFRHHRSSAAVQGQRSLT